MKTIDERMYKSVHSSSIYKKNRLFKRFSAHGASDENRTHVCSLEGCRSTIELHSHNMVSRKGIEPSTH